MLKTIGVVVGGIFVGAVAAEILREKCPEKVDALYAKVKSFSDRIKAGFNEGYCSVTQRAESTEA